MKILFVLLITISCQSIKAQDSVNHFIQGRNVIMYDTCQLFIPFIWEDGSHKLVFKYKGGLTAYFKENIKKEIRNKISGQLSVQILISTQGKTCCKSIYVKPGESSVTQIDQIGIDRIVNDMPNWIIQKPNRNDKTPTNFSITIDMEFSKNGNLFVWYDKNKKIIFVK